MIIGGRYYFGMRINGEEVKHLDPAWFQSIKIIQSVSDTLPIADFTFVDNQTTFETAPAIDDGSLIEVAYGEDLSGSDVTWIPFRVYTTVESPNTNVGVVTMSMYYDKPKIFSIASYAAVEGPATAVVSKIANDNGLEAVLDTSSDGQVWIQPGISDGMFLQNVTRHAYQNELSAFASCVTIHGEILFVNVTERIQQDPKWDFVSIPGNLPPLKENQILIPNYRRANSSGFLNTWQGYGQFAAQLNVATGAQEQVFVDTVFRDNDYLNVHADLAVPVRTIQGPLDCGNTHKNYFRAELQNKKNLALYNEQIQAISSFGKPEARLLDVGIFSMFDDSGGFVRSLTGKALIEKIVTYITPDDITHKYYLCRNSFSSEGKDAGSAI